MTWVLHGDFLELGRLGRAIAVVVRPENVQTLDYLWCYGSPI